MARRNFSSLPIRDFSGGWNPRDALSAVEDNESPDMMNVTLDERGGVVKRLGLTRLNSADQISSSGNVQSMHYSPAIDRTLGQIGSGLYVSTDGGVTWGASIKSFSNSSRCHMVDFLGKVVIIHPSDQVCTYDGTTVSSTIANSPKGTCIAVWNNALYSIGDPSNPSRVTRSDNGAITWPSTGLVTNDIRSKNDMPLTSIGGGQGMDVQGRDGLIVCKEESAYRIYDSTTLAYSIISHTYGASGPQCVTTNYGYTAAISKRGIILMPPGGAEPVYASDKLIPLFQSTQITYANASTMVAANHGPDRMVFSIPRFGATTNSLTLEYSLPQGWFVPHDFGLSAATTYLKNADTLYGGKVGSSASDYGYVYDVFSGGDDDGVDITSRFQTRWFEPGNGNDIRYRRAVVEGRGRFNLYVRRDYDTGLGDLYAIDLLGDVSTWGGTTWGGGTWSKQRQQSYAEIYSLGFGRSITLEVQETSSLTAASLKLLDDGATNEIGAWGLYGLTIDMVPLGNT